MVGAEVPKGAAELWPLAALRIRVHDVELRPVFDDDGAALARVLPDDVELDPAMSLLRGLPLEQARAVAVRQVYWRALGSWTPSTWHLHFAVRRAGYLVGEQELEGVDFTATGTVDTSSWLRPSARGLGTGRAMRRAVLALAFGPLGARMAVTSAWSDNAASLGVSRSLGYQPNGERLHPRGNGAGVMTHLRMDEVIWRRSGHQAGVVVEGLQACRTWFGLDDST